MQIPIYMLRVNRNNFLKYYKKNCFFTIFDNLLDSHSQKKLLTIIV
jgi:hypothetical protein